MRVKPPQDRVEIGRVELVQIVACRGAWPARSSTAILLRSLSQQRVRSCNVHGTIDVEDQQATLFPDGDSLSANAVQLGECTLGHVPAFHNCHPVSISELGFPEFELVSWYGVAAPAKTPDAIIARWSDAIAKSVADPATRERVASTGAEPLFLAGADFSRKVREEIAKYTVIGRRVRMW